MKVVWNSCGKEPGSEMKSACENYFKGQTVQVVSIKSRENEHRMNWLNL